MSIVGYRRVALAVIAAFFFAAGCRQAGDPQGFNDVLTGLAAARNFDEVKRYYTAGTIGAIERAAAVGTIDTGERLYVLPRFTAATRWDELSRTVTGDRGVMRIRYREHPVENMVGTEMDVHLVLEGGAWKIDLELEVVRALKGRNRRAPDEYLERLKQKY